MANSKETIANIKPAGRHLLAIGADLIQDKYAAIIELVKNAYDADANMVCISFATTKSGYKIVVEDDGEGMSHDTVLNKWMVPSTPDKLNRKTSNKKGRVLQGRKGIGRYSASILGSTLLLETVAQNNEKTTVFIDWMAFSQAEFLSDVEILIETKRTKEECGTRLTIEGDANELIAWDDAQMTSLIRELKKMLSPVASTSDRALISCEFEIKLSTKNFPRIESQEHSGIIQPFPIFDLFDYKISGTIDTKGAVNLEFQQQKIGKVEKESITYQLSQPTGCGSINIDLRVYDREKESIEELIQRGLVNQSGAYVGKLEARQILNEYNGIGVYRNGFRIRPMGDADYDWLTLNKDRVQNPSIKVGSNQVIGYVQIESEEQSGLIEKSARDGLKDNESFNQLKDITKKVLIEIETRRFQIRSSLGLGRKAIKLEKKFEELFDYSVLKNELRSSYKKMAIDKETIENLFAAFDKDAAIKNEIVQSIRNEVAVYQGQATLGKILTVVIHEGRKPLGYFKNTIPLIEKWKDVYITNKDERAWEKLKTAFTNIELNAKHFVHLFKKIDPLASTSRSGMRSKNLKQIIDRAIALFEFDFARLKIDCSVSCDSQFELKCWEQDIIAVFANLIENSVYWIERSGRESGFINFNVSVIDGQFQLIDIQDSGPGIDPKIIESGALFEPNFTTKINGTGLGLTIAGEAADRNALVLSALNSQTGAYFRLQPKELDSEPKGE